MIYEEWKYGRSSVGTWINLHKKGDEKVINVTLGEMKFDKKENKRFIKILMLVAGIYTIAKTTMDNEKEIIKLKKVIEEMKSKGE